MTDRRADGLDVFKELMPGVMPDNVESLRDGGFAHELGELSLDHVFGSLWTRPGLGRRERSLVTLGALIAMRAVDELRFHMPIAARAIGREVLPPPQRDTVTDPTAHEV